MSSIPVGANLDGFDMEPTVERDKRGANDNSFVGRFYDLHGSVYDEGATDPTKNFMKTTKEIAIDVAREYDKAGGYRSDLVNLHMSELAPSEDPNDDARSVIIEKWKLA